MLVPSDLDGTSTLGWIFLGMRFWSLGFLFYPHPDPEGSSQPLQADQRKLETPGAPEVCLQT